MSTERVSTRGLLKAAHFGPTVIVVTVSYLLSLTQFSSFDSLRITIAIFAGQLVVGWSNDLIDFDLDNEAKRMHKPLVTGEVSSRQLVIALPIAATAAVLLSLLSPLGVKGSLIHILGLGSAVAYNAKLKSTIYSPIPYIISFGALPWAIYVAAGEKPPTWILLGFILFATAFHFLNVLKDLEWDIEQEVLGLPQRIGKRASITTAIVLVILAITQALLLR
jgi:4-hydroxybenzoate polyprenyltransferase